MASALLGLGKLGRDIRAMPPHHLVIDVADPGNLMIVPRRAVRADRNQRIGQHRLDGILLIGDGARNAVRGVDAAGVDDGSPMASTATTPPPRSA
jgi:hypothetical protein